MGNKLKEARKVRGLTQEQVATLAGIDRSTYSHIERGSRDPSFKAASGIARVLGTHIEDLFLPSCVRITHEEQVATSEDRLAG